MPRVRPGETTVADPQNEEGRRCQVHRDKQSVVDGLGQKIDQIVEQGQQTSNTQSHGLETSLGIRPFPG